MQVPPCKQLISTKSPVSDLKLLPLFFFSKSHQTSSILTTYLKNGRVRIRKAESRAFVQTTPRCTLCLGMLDLSPPSGEMYHPRNAMLELHKTSFDLYAVIQF
jgi:hypothetical protein